MTQNKQIKEFAKQLLKMSVEGGDLSAERVDGVLTALNKNPPYRCSQGFLEAGRTRSGEEYCNN